jgi:dTDP-4-dehydrorhamnose reductase
MSFWSFNPKSKVLILGGSGFLGFNLVKHFSQLQPVMATYNQTQLSDFSGVSWIKFKAEDYTRLKQILVKMEPKVVINCIALTSIEECQLNQNKAEFLNRFFPIEVAKVCKSLEIQFVHISTDHQESITGKFRTEHDPSFWVNKYGETKILGDEEIIMNNPKSIVVRTNFFGWDSIRNQSLLDLIFNSIKKGELFYGFSDVEFTPVSIYELFRNISYLLDSSFEGVVNISSNRSISKYEFAKIVASYLHSNSNMIIKSSIYDSSLLTQRPKNMSLDNSLLRSIIGHEIPTVEDMVECTLRIKGNSNDQ